MTETLLWLLRHPEPESSAKGRCYGSLDVALSSDGAQHARRLADALAGVSFDSIYSSPRRRCLQAAESVADRRASRVQPLDAIRELDFGEFEGRSYDEIAQTHPDVYRQWMDEPTKVQFPGGESFDAMQGRVIAAVGELRRRHKGQTIALVTHGGVVRIILADALGIPTPNLFRLGQSYGAINRIRYFGDSPVVEVVNADAGMDFSKR